MFVFFCFLGCLVCLFVLLSILLNLYLQHVVVLLLFVCTIHGGIQIQKNGLVFSMKTKKHMISKRKKYHKKGTQLYSDFMYHKIP